MPIFWFQGLISLAVWVAYGVWMARHPEATRAFARRRPPAMRGILAAGLLLLAVFLLFGSLSGIYALGGFRGTSMAIWAWLFVTLTGLAFVHLQTLAMALGMSIAQESVTQARSAASATMEPSQDHEDHRPA